ncbi:YrhK family protein [Staphylococcus petrasii]|uniref:YrhK family protein n=1 Tax=Staphylococcus petrasii TaxID=1276936 RepID=UPI001F56A567|nr:YrhK family protein [Staphylococcus petrasii]MCI2774343.1 YrhK family protein [Staphylococcus petrasii]
MAGLNKDDVDLHFNTNKFNEDNHAKQISFFYKALYQINDIVLGLIFLVGSFLFFSDTTVFIGTVLFVIGSIQMMIRPLISFIHDLKLSRYYKHKYRELEKEQQHK